MKKRTQEPKIIVIPDPWDLTVTSVEWQPDFGTGTVRAKANNHRHAIEWQSPVHEAPRVGDKVHVTISPVTDQAARDRPPTTSTHDLTD